jgi:hypothetical protein
MKRIRHGRRWRRINAVVSLVASLFLIAFGLYNLVAGVVGGSLFYRGGHELSGTTEFGLAAMAYLVQILVGVCGIFYFVYRTVTDDRIED